MNSEHSLHVWNVQENMVHIFPALCVKPSVMFVVCDVFYVICYNIFNVCADHSDVEGVPQRDGPKRRA